jgi:hypothetical protein
MASQRIALRLPINDWPRATIESDYGWRGAVLSVEGRDLLRARSRQDLESGVEGWLPGHHVRLRLVGADPEVLVDGRIAPREDRLRAPPSRAAWLHALQALLASLFGFLASWMYLKKGDPWAFKMGAHTLGWHLLLVVTLFPASLWGQRAGIRAVQLVSAIFFFIHAGIALANGAEVAAPIDVWIAVFNALSGVVFAVAVWYGQVAWRSMDPIVALRAGRASRG